MHSIQTLDRMVIDECYTVDISISVIQYSKVSAGSGRPCEDWHAGHRDGDVVSDVDGNVPGERRATLAAMMKLPESITR
jgi:hypothetical protein